MTADSTEPERVAPSPDAWIATVPWSEATGVLRDAYDWQAAKLGEPTEFTQLGSLAPELVMLRLELYRTVEAVDSNLTVEEKRLAAYVTSIVNSTPHCSSGLELQLHRLGIDPEVIARAAATPEALASGNERWDEIVAHASVLAALRRRSGPSTSSGCAPSDSTTSTCSTSTTSSPTTPTSTASPPASAWSRPSRPSTPSEPLPNDRRSPVGADRSLAVPRGLGRGVGRRFVAAEEAGIDELWLGDEGPSRDPFSVLAAAAQRTDRITLGVSVTNPFLRHPAVTAATAMTAQRAVRRTLRPRPRPRRRDGPRSGGRRP